MAISANIDRQISKQVSEAIRESFEKRINLAFLKIKRAMISEFLNHPVTVEIKNGPNASNTSGTLNGYGNLFSYIGFYNGDEPINPILQELEKSTIVFAGLIRDGASWNIFLPSKEDIWDVSPMPWAPGRSWAKGIESGISGVGYYLYLEREVPQSRSETAIQTKNKIGSRTRFRNTRYISDILTKYEKLFSQLDEASIST